MGERATRINRGMSMAAALSARGEEHERQEEEPMQFNPEKKRYIGPPPLILVHATRWCAGVRKGRAVCDLQNPILAVA